MRRLGSGTRRGAAAAMLTLTALGTVFVPIGHADAGKLVTCTGTSTATFTPGLTMTPQQVSRTDTADYTCQGRHGETFTAHSVAQLPPDYASCSTPTVNSHDTQEITWQDGTTSTLTSESAEISQRKDDPGDSMVVVLEEGHVTAGRAAGKHYAMAVAVPNLDLQKCASPEGVQSVKGTAELSIDN
jgi:hypothetical protein